MNDLASAVPAAELLAIEVEKSMTGSSPAKTGVPDVSRELQKAARDGLALCQTRGAPVLLRFAIPIDGFDVGHFLDLAWRRKIDAMAFRSTLAASEYYCWGSELEVTGSQLDALKPVLGELQDKVVAEGEGLCPLVFFGSSFTQGQWDEERRRTQSPWVDWPPALLRVPAWVASHNSETNRWVLTVNLWIRPDFDAEKILNQITRRVTQAHMLARPRTGETLTEALQTAQPVESKAEWCRRVDDARQACGGPRLRKVVLARSIEYPLSEGRDWDLASTWNSLLRQESGSTTFAFLRNGAAFLGATPESLLRINQGQVETHALAGTAPRGDTPKQDAEIGAQLLRSAKDLQEHQLVVRNITDTLYPWCKAVLVDHRPRLRILGRVQHLETRINAQIKKGNSLLALSAALHPTPALAGAPQGAALSWLQRTEKMDRGWFGGLLGFVNRVGEGEAWVSIRSALLDRERAFVFAGAGIVEASDPEAEWTETELKSQTMANALCLSIRGAKHD